MGKHWRKYVVGKYRLGQLHGEAVVCWRDATGPHRRRLGVWTEIEARAALDTWLGNVTLLKERESKTVQDIWDAYRADREKDGKLIANFDNDWKALKARFGGMEIAAITADICRNYADDRFANGKSPSTIWTELTRLRSCINWAQKRRVIVLAPYVWVPTKPDGRQNVMTEEQVLALIDGCRMPHIRLFVILAITTGGRSGALCQLLWTHVDFKTGTIDLRITEIINPLKKRTHKGRAVVAMTAEARAALLEAKAGAITDFVIEWNGEPVKKIRKAFTTACEIAGLGIYRPDKKDPTKQIFVPSVSPHVLRHTVATWLDEDDIPLERISKLLGHRNTKSTRIYAKPGAQVLRPAADVIDLRLKRKK